MNNKSSRLPVVFLFAAMEICFISYLMAPFLKECCNIAPFAMSLLLISKNISRMFMELPLGIVADRFSFKWSFFISRMAKVFALVLLLFRPNIASLLLAMVLYGVSMSALYGKIDAYMYRLLNERDRVSGFRKIITIYYFFCDIIIALAGVVVGFLFDNFGYDGLIKVSLLVAVASLPLLFLFPATININECKNNLPIRSIIADAATTLKQKPFLIYVAIIIGCGCGVIWQSGNVISMVLVANNVPNSIIVHIYTASIVAMGLGYGISLWLSKYLKVERGILLFALATIMLMIVGSFGNIISLLMFLAMVIIFPIVQSGLEKLLESSINNSSRGTITSVYNFIATGLNIASTLLFGFGLQNNYDRQLLMTVILVMALVPIIYSTIQLLRYEEIRKI